MIFTGPRASPPARSKRPRKPYMTGPQYEIVAAIVRTLPDALREPVADHFAREFNRRSPSFDPMAWETRTGGRLTERKGAPTP